jgi:hypothetical protein
MRSKQLLAQIASRLDAIERNVDRIELATLVREPGNSTSVDAYNGLRKQVVAAAGERIAHLAQLSQVDVAVRDGVVAEQLAPLVDEWLRQSDLERSQDVSRPDLFQVVSGDGPVLVVIQPSYVDRITGRIVRQGLARREHKPDTSGPQSTGGNDATLEVGSQEGEAL